MVIGAYDIADLMLRAAVAALNLLVAAQLARTRPPRFVTVSGALFCLGVAAYAIVSPADIDKALGIAREPLVVMAVLAPALFWCFGLALFRDTFRWRHAYAIPPILLLAFYALRFAGSDDLTFAANLLHQLTLVLLLGHIVVLAVRDFGNDLVDARRRFRLVVALALPAVGIATAAGETYGLFGPLPPWLSPLHGVLLLALSFAFTLWIASTRQELFAPAAEAPQPRADLLTSPELIELERLKTAIANGACFEPDLTLGALARQINVPEHRLRRLIGKGLGYRNFSAFINDHRVSEAKRRLADPERSREQIVAIAFGLGYASLAPFNRAFRQLTGTTPSEYRSRMLARVIDSGNI
jgi:AraC-like DNA-binding protein